MAELTEQKVYEALGITPGTPAEGAKEREPAAPADQGKKPNEDGAPADGALGEQEQEPAATATEEGDPADQPAAPEGGQEEQPSGKPPMSEEERREAAAQRRRQEQQAAIDDAVEKAIQAEREKSQGELEGFFKSAQLKNTFTGEPITSMEEFWEWKKAFDAAKLQKDLKAGKLTQEDLDQVISEHPAVKRAQEIAQQADQAKEEQEKAAAQRRIAAEMVEIQKLDPSIKDVADLLKMPTAKEFYTYVTKNHLSYLDAFKLANRERLEQQAAEAARQQTATNIRGKEHLTTTKPQGAGAATVPPEEMRMFRLMNPDATEAQIQEYYNKHKKP